MPEVVVTAHSSDCDIYGLNASWATARATSTSLYGNDWINNGVYLSGGSHKIVRMLFKFDTSVIPDGATVTRCRLRLRAATKQAPSPANYRIVKANWSAYQDPQDSGANREGCYDAAIAGAVDTSFSTSSIVVGQDFYSANFTDLTWISKTGYTFYAVVIDKDYDDNETEVDYNIQWDASESTHPPALVIEYDEDILGQANLSSTATCTGSAFVLSVTTPLWKLGAARGFKIGAANPYACLSTGGAPDTYRDVLKLEFSHYVMEDKADFGTVEPSQGNFDFTYMDATRDWCKNNGMTWHNIFLGLDCPDSYLPSWLTSMESSLTRTSLLAILKNHIQTVALRYIDEGDHTFLVANEPLEDSSSWELQDCIWLRVIGEDYLEKAFEYARQVLPDAVLVLSDYGIEPYPNNGKSNAMYDLVVDWVSQGLPLDSVAFHGSLLTWGDPWNLTGMALNIERYYSIGIDVQLARVDYRIAKPITEAKKEQQAAVYRQMVDIIVAAGSQKVSYWGTWGVSDEYSDKEDGSYGGALLFGYLSESFERKPAYDEVAEAFAKETLPPLALAFVPPEYQVWVLNDDYSRCAYIDEFADLTYKICLNGIGYCNVQVAPSNIQIPDLRVMKRLMVIRDDKIVHFGIILREHFTIPPNAPQEEAWQIVSRDNAVYFDWRVTVPPTGEEYDKRGPGPADDIAKAYVRGHCGVNAIAARQIPDLTVAPDLSKAPNVTYEARNIILLTVLQNLAIQGGFDWLLVPNETLDGVEFRTYYPHYGVNRTRGNGANREAVFSLDRRNFIRMTYAKDTLDHYNYVYIWGQGEGVDRQMAEGGDDVAIAFYKRRERYIDSRQTSLEESLEDEIPPNLKENRMEQGMTVVPTPWSWGNPWDLGDLVTIEAHHFENDFSFDGKIVAIEVDVDRDGREQVTPEIVRLD